MYLLSCCQLLKRSNDVKVVACRMRMQYGLIINFKRQMKKKKMKFLKCLIKIAVKNMEEKHFTCNLLIVF